MILDSAIKENKLNSAENIPVFASLKVLAKTNNNPAAMVLLGRIYEGQKKDDAALEMYRRAAVAEAPEAPSRISTTSNSERDFAGDALLREGLLQHRRNHRAAALTALRKAALEHRNASAYYQLAKLEGPDAETYEPYLLKAAELGIPDVSHDLGMFYAARATGIAEAQTGGKACLADERAWLSKMATEWLTLSASMGNAESRLMLQDLLDQEAAPDRKPWFAAVLEAPVENERKSPPLKKMRGMRGVRSR
jgi:tetratricopeptide (TPR) repeat protein